MSISTGRLVEPRTWVALTTALILVIGMALVTGGIASAGLEPGGTFTDDDGNTHEGFIEAIAAAGITAGCDATGTLYCPNDSVTRGQMATFLARALALPAASDDYFADDDGSTHEASINQIFEAGITTGFTDGTYQPDGTVRRDQMASFLSRGIESLDPATMDYFTDDDGNTHEANINAMAENGITLGCDTNGTLYCPEEFVGRDQMASFLGRALDLTEIIPPPTTTTTTEATTTTSGATTSTSGATTSTSGATTSTTAAPQTEVVDVLDNEFDDDSVTINVGDSVQFSKMTSGFHDVTFTSGGFGANPEGSTTSTFTWTVEFNSAGTFTYVCTIHAGIGMTGTVTVNS